MKESDKIILFNHISQNFKRMKRKYWSVAWFMSITTRLLNSKYSISLDTLKELKEEGYISLEDGGVKICFNHSLIIQYLRKNKITNLLEE